MSDNFNEELNKVTIETEEIIYSYLPKEEGLQSTVLEAMNYSMKAGGKRLRPILMRETAKFFGTDNEEVKPFMAAMEMIHTYSLVHDDLPAMDNDAFRRGLPTTHIKYGHAMGILAGDALLNYAYEMCANAIVVSKDMIKAAKAFKVLSSKAGIFGMVGGQTVDVEYTGNGTQMNKEVLDFIFKLKTGALIEASMMIGAILSDANDEEIKKIEEIASAIGMAFQIQDDILDVTSTMEVLGKPVMSDEKNHKETFVSLYGTDKSVEMVKAYTKEAIDKLDDIRGKNDFLRELLMSLIYREK